MNNDYFIITFSSTHQAIHFDRILQQKFKVELIPTPRSITASCGLSLKFNTSDLSDLLMTIKNEDKTGLKLLKFVKEKNETEITLMPWGD